MSKVKLLIVLILLGIGLNAQPLLGQSFNDDPFLQPVSKKHLLKADGNNPEVKKMIIDRDNTVLVLTDQGVFVVIEGQLVKDRRFRPLTNFIPVDIALQDGTDAVYYLYEGRYLSNAYAGLPYGEFEEGAYNQIAVNQSGDVLLAGQNNYKLVKDDSEALGNSSSEILEVQVYNDDFFIHTAEGVSIYKDGNFERVVNDRNIEAWTFGKRELFIANDDGYYSLSTSNWREKLTLKTAIPITPVTSMAFRDGTLWAGTHSGMFSTQDYEDYRYFASRRWLASDQVLDVGVDSKGNAFALTKESVSEVQYNAMTLHQKAQYFHEKVRKRHLRLGLIGIVRLSEPGDLTTTEMVDTDNDGLWSAFYAGSEVFRYATTKEEEARKNAMETFMSFERLLSINQLEGFPSRTFARKGYKVSHPDTRWNQSPEEHMEWKGHTSSDEFVSYIWFAGILAKHLDLDSDEKARVAAFIDDIMMHLIRNDYYFVDVDGEPTLWGRWNPEFLNWYPKTVVDRKLGSLTITAGLQLAYELTGKDIYKEEAYRLFEDHGYLENIKIPMSNIRTTPGVIHEGYNMGEGGWNHSDDEMAFLTYYVLYHFAFNDELQNTYADVISDHWEIEKPERNSVWNLVSYGTSGDIDLPSVKWHLREFQMDMVRWSIKNSHRGDLEFLEPNFRDQTTEVLLPPGERSTIRYNANPFDLDSNRGGNVELAGDEFLLPYWMGRYLKVINPIQAN